jgi:hypothetical protein
MVAEPGLCARWWGRRRRTGGGSSAHGSSLLDAFVDAARGLLAWPPSPMVVNLHGCSSPCLTTEASRAAARQDAVIEDAAHRSCVAASSKSFPVCELREGYAASSRCHCRCVVWEVPAEPRGEDGWPLCGRVPPSGAALHLLLPPQRCGLSARPRRHSVLRQPTSSSVVAPCIEPSPPHSWPTTARTPSHLTPPLTLLHGSSDRRQPNPKSPAHRTKRGKADGAKPGLGLLRLLPCLVGDEDYAHLMHTLFMEGKSPFASPNCMSLLELVLDVKLIELCKWCGVKACCAVDRKCDDI